MSCRPNGLSPKRLIAQVASPKRLIAQMSCRPNGIAQTSYRPNIPSPKWHRPSGIAQVASPKGPASIWELRNSGISMDNINIEWSVLDHATAYRNGTRKCNLCLTEKYHIITSPLDLINKRTEFISKCRHENKFYLMNYKEVPPESQSDQ